MSTASSVIEITYSSVFDLVRYVRTTVSYAGNASSSSDEDQIRGACAQFCRGQCQASQKDFGEEPMRYDSKPAIGSSDCILYQFIEDIPEENALCELDCRKHQCKEREWIMCRHRPSELMLHGESNSAPAAQNMILLERL
jgi:hypothetical protein